jgi:ABC-2 type transport system ATP-binding protein
MHAVEVKHLTKCFRRGVGHKPFTAVQDVSFSVEPGEVYGLIGPNGSGKSTTMKALLGLLAPTIGSCSVFGIDSQQVAARQAVGFLPENPYFYKHLTGLETMLFFGRLTGLHGEKLRRHALELLELAGLTDAAQRRLGGYSKGMLQRIGLAQALLNEPKLLVLDEPTAGVDPAGSRRIRDLILDCKRRGITVLVTSHLLEQMQEVCDRVGIMSQGRMVKEGAVQALISLEDQTELLLKDAPAAAIEDVRQLLASKYPGAAILRADKPRTTLERLFLDVTDSQSND